MTFTLLVIIKRDIRAAFEWMPKFHLALLTSRYNPMLDQYESYLVLVKRAVDLKEPPALDGKVSSPRRA